MKPFILLGTLIIGAASVFSESGRAQSSFDPLIAEMISHVSDSTMRQSISDLQNFGTRYSYASTRDTVARWIAQRFLAAGITDVVLDEYPLSGGVVYNVEATIHGTSPDGAEILIGAHYDSDSQSPWTFAPGADDNASGTSAVIELARVISARGYTPRLTLRFVAFWGEELGLVGSSRYAQKAHNSGRDIRVMINFDQIAYRNVGDPNVGIIWYEGAETLAALDTAVIRQYTALTPYLSSSWRMNSDSHSFAYYNYPALWWSESRGTPFHHTAYDILDYIDVSYATEIARSALAFVLTLDNLTVDVRQVSETCPAAVRLYQNYPNPFNPTTTIRYALASRSHVTLTVYTTLGQKVRTLMDEVVDAGYQWVAVDASGLASGAYFYTLQAGDFTQTKRLLLMR